MRRYLEWGGVAAGVVLVIFGVAAIALGVNARGDVRDALEAEKIVGGDDMSPALIQEGIDEAGLTDVDVPEDDIVGEPIDTGAEARTFAGYMRIHALESAGGLTYAQMGRFATENGEPLPNTARNTWVTETALSTALNMSYMAEQLALFGIVVGVALLLSGIGFLVLALGGALRRQDAAA